MIIIKDTSGRIIKEVHVNDDLNLIIRLEQDTELQQAKKEIERLRNQIDTFNNVTNPHILNLLKPKS